MAQSMPAVVICGTGQYGLEATRILVGKGWPIVAAYNRRGSKIGRDLGELAGLKPLGVVIEDIDAADLRSDAKVAIVAVTDRLKDNLPIYRRLFEAGLNVVCHGAEAYFPWGADPTTADLIDQLAKQHRVTLTGTGIWDFSRIWAGICVAGPTSRIDRLFHRSITDAEAANQALARVCGVSMTQEEFASSNPAMIGGLYKLVPHHVMHALGYTVSRVIETSEPIVSDQPTFSRIFDRELAPGTVLGIRIITTIETEQGVGALAHSELRILAEGEREHMYWEVEGRPASSVRVDRTDSVHMSAACLVNRVPDVLAAAPGIRLVSELGPLLPKGL